MSTSELEVYRQTVWDSLSAIGGVSDFEGLFINNEEDFWKACFSILKKNNCRKISEPEKNRIAEQNIIPQNNEHNIVQVHQME